MFLLTCKSQAGRSTEARNAAPESLQFTSILPRTLLVMMVPFLKERLGADFLEGAVCSLVHDRVQRLDDVKVDVIVVVAKTSLAPWDRAGKRT